MQIATGKSVLERQDTCFTLISDRARDALIASVLSGIGADAKLAFAPDQSTKIYGQGQQRMRTLLKFLASQIDVDTYQRLSAHSILKREFSEIRHAPVVPRREKLWDRCIEMCGGATAKITFVEFGVHKGYSIGYFCGSNVNNGSIFIGLDSFEGLPEPWLLYPKGHFTTDGAIPTIEDPRVSFIQGWFQNTSDEVPETLIVHYDADLYSSTLFALCKIDGLGKNYYAIFDEFSGHEVRALYDYSRSHNASVRFLAKTLGNGYPLQMLCEIVPNHRGQ